MDMEGYSVAKVQRPMSTECYRVYRHNTYVGCISTNTLSNRMSFEWHDKLMWGFHATDFVKVETR